MTWRERIDTIIAVFAVAVIVSIAIMSIDSCNDRRAHREQHRMGEP